MGGMHRVSGSEDPSLFTAHCYGMASLLMGQLKQGRAEGWVLDRLMTIGEACRTIVKEALRTTLARAIEQITVEELPVELVVARFGML